MPKKAPRRSTSKTKAVRFDLHSPEAQRVSLAGDFNGWDVDALPMERDQKGTWTTGVSLQPGRHAYRFYVDGSWQDDPKAQERVDNPFGSQNCVKIVG